jgi:hypothetical protein
MGHTTTHYSLIPRICSTFIYIHRIYPQPSPMPRNTSHITNTLTSTSSSHTSYSLISAISNFELRNSQPLYLSPSPSFLIAAVRSNIISYESLCMLITYIMVMSQHVSTFHDTLETGFSLEIARKIPSKCAHHCTQV